MARLPGHTVPYFQPSQGRPQRRALENVNEVKDPQIIPWTESNAPFSAIGWHCLMWGQVSWLHGGGEVERRKY